jgi:hypothetical protein
MAVVFFSMLLRIAGKKSTAIRGAKLISQERGVMKAVS